MNHSFEKLLKKLQAFHLDESGPTAVEYAILLGVIVLMAVKMIQVTGVSTSEFYQYSADELGRTL